MRTLSMAGDITRNQTLLPDGSLEQGCRVVLSDASKENARRFWSHAGRLPGVTCAHVSIYQSAQGCVYDIFAPSNCPK